MDGKSIMGLLLLSASYGTTVTISADGSDEQEALAALRGLVERGFDEATLVPVSDKPFDSHGETGMARGRAADKVQDKP